MNDPYKNHKPAVDRWVDQAKKRYDQPSAQKVRIATYVSEDSYERLLQDILPQRQLKGRDGRQKPATLSDYVRELIEQDIARWDEQR